MSILPGLLLAVCINAQAQQTAASCDPEGPALEQARELLRSTPLIDGHNDLPWVIREATGGDVLAYGLISDKDRDTDIPKLHAGLLGAQFWSVWIPGEIPLTDYGRH